MGERLLAFRVCEEEEDRTDSERMLGSSRMEKTQPISRKSRICVNRSESHIKNMHEA